MTSSGTTEARVGPLPADRWGDDVLDALRSGRGSLLAAELREALDAEDVARLAEILPNAITTMFVHPPLASGLLAFTGVFLSGSALPPRWRELVVLRVAWRTGCTYEWLQHVRMSPRFEITPAEIEAIAQGSEARTWTQVEGALLRAADQFIDGYTVDDATWSLLAGHLDERQLVELPFLVGAYFAQALAYNGLRIQPDPSLRDVAPPVMPPAAG